MPGKKEPSVVLIRLGYDFQFDIPAPTALVAMLSVHPTRFNDLLEPNVVHVDPPLYTSSYHDSFGNHCTRINAAAGPLRVYGSTLIRDSGQPDPVCLTAREIPVRDLPHDVLQFLISSRYCEVDRFINIACELFGGITPGWNRVQAICDWVHSKIRFDYSRARSTMSALDLYTERTGVCRDFQHMAITFCRALNIPARYATGYLGDIGVPPAGPMDFSAWFQVYLDHQWWTFDARNNQPRIGRVLMATGRDASDVALTTAFGKADLKSFRVVTEEVPSAAAAVKSPFAVANC